MLKYPQPLFIVMLLGLSFLSNFSLDYNVYGMRYIITAGFTSICLSIWWLADVIREHMTYLTQQSAQHTLQQKEDAE